MDPDELKAIRAAGLQGGGNAGGDDAESQEQKEAQRANEEQARRDLIATVLESAARERRMDSDCLLFCSRSSSMNTSGTD